jgi:hypothetical protein
MAQSCRSPRCKKRGRFLGAADIRGHTGASQQTGSKRAPNPSVEAGLSSVIRPLPPSPGLVAWQNDIPVVAEKRLAPGVQSSEQRHRQKSGDETQAAILVAAQTRPKMLPLAGTYSLSQHHRVTCSHHLGVAEWLTRRAAMASVPWMLRHDRCSRLSKASR